MPAPDLHVQVAVRQDRQPTPRDALVLAVRNVLQGEDIPRALISIAIVDDAEMQELNRRHLNHDYPTDVLSFLLEETPVLEGELIISADTAAREAPLHGATYLQELLLYAVHGTLHLVGYDDQDAADQRLMRRKERLYLEPFCPPGSPDSTG